MTWGLRDYGTGDWQGGDENCDHRTGPLGGRGKSSMNSGESHERWIAKLDEGIQYSDLCRKCGARRVDQQIGLERTVDEYVENLVIVFRELRRVLAPHGTAWLNLGDSYAGGGGGNYGSGISVSAHKTHPTSSKDKPGVPQGLKAKDLIGVPWKVAFALQGDGWWLRSDIVWSKRNCMPESVTDRPTKSHEYIFMLTKSPNYFFDQEAVREPFDPKWKESWEKHPKNELIANPDSPYRKAGNTNGGGVGYPEASGRNIRSVWEMTSEPYPGSHFATFPQELPRKAILAGCPQQVCRVCGKPRERIIEKPQPPAEIRNRGAGSKMDFHTRQVGSGQVLQDWYEANPPRTIGWSDCGHGDFRVGVTLDPFMGSGTTAFVARKLGRHAVGIELNPDYAALIANRTQQLSLLS